MSMIKDFRDSAGDILLAVKDLLHLTNTRSVNDFNKAARQNELTTYSLVSDNVTSEIFSRLSAGLEAQLLANIKAIVTNAVLADPNKAVDFVKNNFTNNGDMTNKLKSAVSDLSDHLSEGLSISEMNITFNNSLMEADVTVGGRDDFNKNKINSSNSNIQKATAMSHKQIDKNFDNKMKYKGIKKSSNTYKFEKFKKDTDQELQNAAINKTDIGFKANSQATNAPTVQLPGHFHEFSIKYTGIEGVGKLDVTVFIRTQIIVVESTKVIDAIGSTKGRSMFNNYLQMRASGNGFLKGFLLNLKEIEKQVNRDTSKDMTDRILGSLLAKGGFTRPKMLGEITEFKNYNLILSTDDVDRLAREQGLNLSKASDLKKVFNGLNILALLIVDEVKGRVIFYESSDPANMTIVNIKTLSETEKLNALFSTINRG